MGGQKSKKKKKKKSKFTMQIKDFIHLFFSMPL